MDDMPQRRTIAVVGLGYVGIPLALLFLRKGFHIIGIDINQNKVDLLKRGICYLSDVSNNVIANANKTNRWKVTSSFYEVQSADTIIICVPTPLNDNSQPDLHYVEDSVKRIKPYLKKGQLVILESSTYPGTTEEVLVPILLQDDWVVGRDLFIGYSPERIDPGNRKFGLKDIPKVVSGISEECNRQIIDLYSRVFNQVVPVSSTRAAEMVKILENSQRFINISFMNEITQFCRLQGIDIWEVIDAASTKPYGFTPYFPGPGIGGHCIPVDPLYLKWKANQLGLETHFIDIAHKINERMPDEVLHFVKRRLYSETLAQKKFLVVGVTYKKDVNDIRDSSALRIISNLIDQGAIVEYHDPYIDVLELSNRKISSRLLDELDLPSFDCALILVDHSNIDYQRIVDQVPCVIDTRNAIKKTLNKKNVHFF